MLTGLIDAGERSSSAVVGAVAYLLREQRPDGTWPHGDWLQAIVPPETFYILAEAAKHYPAEALAHWLTGSQRTQTAIGDTVQFPP